MPPLLSITSLSHSYGPRLALDNISLTLHRSEIFALLGPNGSGKTTLFRILSTLLPPQSGEVTYNLHPSSSFILHPSSFPQIRPHLAIVFQSPSLDKQLTTEENLRHHGHLYGLRGPDLESRITHQLTRFALTDRRRDRISTLSGGLRRRVELAKGLLTNPTLLLMDEPSTGLDPSARLDMWSALTAARQQDGLTILLTTHLMDEADKCDRLAIMDRGRIVALGTPAELKETIGGDVITVTSPDPQQVIDRLTALFSLKPELVDGTLRIERPAAHEFVPQLAQSLPGLIDSISVGKPTLEDVFIHLTGRRLETTDLSPQPAHSR